jgi:HlyD family secretion protein
VGVFGATIALSTVLNYNVAVKVPAVIRPAGELRLVQPAIEGVVEQIEVKENQLVNQGQPIARLDDSRLQIQKSQLQETLRQLQLQLVQVNGQISNLDAQGTAQSHVLASTLASVQAELASSQRNYRDQQVFTQADLAEAEAAWKVATAQRERLLRDKELESTLREAEAALQIARAQRDRLFSVLESGAVSRNQYEEKEQAVKVAEAKLQQTQAAAKKLLEEKEEAVQIARAKLERARAALNPSDAAVEIAAERIGLEQAKGKASLAGLNRERQTLMERRIQLQTQLDQAQKELQQVETNLRQTIIRAPVAGTLLQLQLRNQGQVVQPGQPTAYIAPAHSPLFIKARVAAQDIDKVKPGQAVQMQVSACPHPDYGTLQGTVQTVAPDALPSSAAGTAASPAPATYEVTIKPHSQALGRSSHQCQLQAGMEGRADIISRQETIMRFILRKTQLLVDL